MLISCGIKHGTWNVICVCVVGVVKHIQLNLWNLKECMVYICM